MTTVQQTEVEITPDGRQLWSHFSHLSYNDFDRTGNFGQEDTYIVYRVLTNPLLSHVP